VDITFTTGEIALITVLLGALTTPLGLVFKIMLNGRDRELLATQTQLTYEREQIKIRIENLEKSHQAQLQKTEEDCEQRLQGMQSTYLALIQMMRDNTIVTQENTKSLQAMADILGLSIQSQENLQKKLPSR